MAFIISPKYDQCIKQLFRNTLVLKYFLSDILDIPVEEIKSLKLLNTLLWRKYKNEKQGILDILVELEDGTRINIEMQLRISKSWDKRQVFYLSKMFTSDLQVGEDYARLKRCVAISILDFNLTDREEYHNVYHLRDEDGNLFSDILEIHTLELRKKLTGMGRMDDWIRLFNAKSREDLDMIKTNNPGILEAIREIKEMGLSKTLRVIYEARLKEIRDQRAIEAYIRDEAREQGLAEGREKGMQEGIQQGMQEGIQQGMQQGIEQGIELAKKVINLSAKGFTKTEIAKKLNISENKIEEILKD